MCFFRTFSYESSRARSPWVSGRSLACHSTSRPTVKKKKLWRHAENAENVRESFSLWVENLLTINYAQAIIIRRWELSFEVAGRRMKVKREKISGKSPKEYSRKESIDRSENDQSEKTSVMSVKYAYGFYGVFRLHLNCSAVFSSFTPHIQQPAECEHHLRLSTFDYDSECVINI